jgi:hypothetical protein
MCLLIQLFICSIFIYFYNLYIILNKKMMKNNQSQIKKQLEQLMNLEENLYCFDCSNNNNLLKHKNNKYYR